MSISVFIPGYPRGKNDPRCSCRGSKPRPYKAKEDVEYEGRVAAAARQVMGSRPFLDCPVTLTVEARFSPIKSISKKLRACMLCGQVPPAKKPDNSNILKAVEDGMNGIVFRDDALIVQLHMRKIYSEIPGVAVCIEEWVPENKDKDDGKAIRN